MKKEDGTGMKKTCKGLKLWFVAGITAVCAAVLVAGAAQATNAAGVMGLPPGVWAETTGIGTETSGESGTSAAIETTPAPAQPQPETTRPETQPATTQPSKKQPVTTQATTATAQTSQKQPAATQPTTAPPTTTQPMQTQPVTAQPPQTAVTTTTAAQSSKTLEALYGNLGGSTRGYEAIQARISGNVLTIDVYVNFKGAYDAKIEGQTCASLAKQGLRLWAGAYKGSRYDFEPGVSFTVQVNIHDIYNGAGARSGQNYFDFVCLTGTGRAFTFFGVGYYNRELLGTYSGAIPDKSYTNGSIGMYIGLGGRYTANQYVKVSAHEFGHVLGLGDLYGKGVASTQECPHGKQYVSGDIMGTHGAVTPNNIEMMLEAYTANTYQAYVNSGLPEVKSRVIRSY